MSDDKDKEVARCKVRDASKETQYKEKCRMEIQWWVIKTKKRQVSGCRLRVKKQNTKKGAKCKNSLPVFRSAGRPVYQSNTNKNKIKKQINNLLIAQSKAKTIYLSSHRPIDRSADLPIILSVSYRGKYYLIVSLYKF